MKRRPENISVRLTSEEAAHLRRWALQDPEDRGMGHVLRRLIREEVEREREREQAGRYDPPANRAG